MSKLNNTCEGRCACGFVSYEVKSAPLITHCCHCRYCQRQTGTAFALNALFAACQLNILSGSVDDIKTESPSGKGQSIARCPMCRIALWSSYFMGGIKKGILFVRVGTLDNPDQFPPDVHIFTTNKQPWVKIPEHAPIFEEFYDYEKIWTKENNDLRKSMLAKVVENK